MRKPYRIISALMALLMVFTLLPLSAAADGAVSGSDAPLYAPPRPPQQTVTVTVSGSYTYDGGVAIVPAAANVTVKKGGNTVPASQYTYACTDNTNAGVATLTVTPKSGAGFSGTRSTTFTIDRMLLSRCMIERVDDQTHTGSKIEPTPLVFFNNSQGTRITLSSGTDFRYRYNNNRNIGTAEIIAEARGNSNYSGSVNTAFKIVASAQATVSVTGDYYYDGGLAVEPKAADIKVMYGTNIVDPNKYTVSCSDNINAGVATLTINPKATAPFTGSISTTYTIDERPLDDCTIASIPEQTYDGRALTPVVAITYKRSDGTIVTLSQTQDYSFTASNNVNVGDATVDIVAKNNYSDSAQVTMKIVAKSVSECTIAPIDDQVYTGVGLTPALTVSFVNAEGDTISLALTDDYTVMYLYNRYVTYNGANDDINNVIAAAYATVKGTGNYSGQKESAKFKILPKPLTVDMVTMPVTDYVYDDTAKEPVPTVADNGFLTADDYTVSYENNIDAGENTAECIVTGKANYTDVITNYFSIAKRPITITPGYEEIFAGEPFPRTLTYTYTNLVSGHTAAAIAHVYKVVDEKGNVYKDSNIDGNYFIKLTDKDAFVITRDSDTKDVSANYDITFIKNKLLIKPYYMVITASAGAGGTISPSGKVNVTHNQSQTFTITPAEGYVVEDVVIDGVSFGALTEHRFQNVVSNHTISVTFRKLDDQTKPVAGIDRLSGADRIATAIAVSKAGWQSSDYVVLASAGSYADALAGTTLAAALNAPVLLTGTDKLDASVLTELKRLGVKNVYILGGNSAISNAIDSSLNAGGMSVIRVGGADRYGTSVEIAKMLAKLTGKNFTNVYFVSGENYPDALSVSAVASAQGNPIIFLPQNGSVEANTSAYLKTLSVKTGTIVGGGSAVSGSAESALAQSGFAADRISGADRYATSLAVNNRYAALFTGSKTVIATGENYPDALAGAAYAANAKAPVLLVGETLTNEQSAFLKQRPVDGLTILGGTAAVSQAVENAIAALIG